MDSPSEVIRCMLLPLAEDALLLPNVSVAEVIAYVEPTNKIENNYVIGSIDWRGATVPIVSFENLCNLASKENSIRDRIAIIYNPDGDINKPYLGIKLVDIPKSFRAEADNLIEESITIEQEEYITNQLIGDEKRLFIPNLDAMFEQLI